MIKRDLCRVSIAVTATTTAALALFKMNHDPFASRHWFFYLLLSFWFFMAYSLTWNIAVALTGSWPQFKSADYGDDTPKLLGVFWSFVVDVIMIGFVVVMLCYVDFDPSSEAYPRPSSI